MGSKAETIVRTGVRMVRLNAPSEDPPDLHVSRCLRERLQPERGQKYLVVHSHSGLGNRLRALVAGRRVAKKTGRHLCVIWELNDYHLWCPYERLFETPHVIVGTDFVLGMGGAQQQYRVGNEPNFIDPESEAELVYVWEENFFWMLGDEGVMWGQFSPWKMKNPELRDELLMEFDSLVPAQHIRKRVAEFEAEHFCERVVGVHIRREDNVWSNKHCHDLFFLWEVSKVLQHMPDAKVFLCTDGEQSEQCMRNWFGDRVVTYPVRSLARGRDAEAIEDALISMLLLSRTNLIVRSCSSTFSQVASWFGRVPTIDVGLLQHDW